MRTTTKLLFTTLTSAMLAVGCSKSGSGGGSSDGGAGGGSSALSISGSLKIQASGSSSTAGALSLGSMSKVSSKGVNRMASSYRIACATFEETPGSCGGAVDDAGAFSISCDGFAGKPFGCFVFNTQTFSNYPLVFNINNEEKVAVKSGTGTITASITLDLETGSATASAVLPTGSTGSTDQTVTQASLAVLEGAYYMSPAPYSEISGRITSEDHAPYLAPVRFWVDYNQSGPNPCPTWAQQNPEQCGDLQNNPGCGACIYTPASVVEGYRLSTCRKFGGGDNEITCMEAARAGQDMALPSDKTQLPTVYFKASEANGKPYFSAWQSQAAYNTCGGNDHAVSFMISDGTTTIDILKDITSTSTNAQVLTNLTTSIDSAVDNWFPVFKELGSTGVAPYQESHVSCKYAYNLPWDFYNTTPDQIAACEADNTCRSFARGNNDMFNTLYNYKFSLLFNGSDESSNSVLVGMTDKNFSDNVVAASSSISWGKWGPWDPDSFQNTIVPIDGTPTEMDLGGCIQWGFNGEPATVVPVGDYVVYRNYSGSNSYTEVKEKCRYSEHRMLYADENGYLAIGDVKYNDAIPYITVGEVKYQTWNKVCQIDEDQQGFTSNDPIYTYPAAMTTAQIVSDMNQRMGGGSIEDKKGRMFEAIYRLLAPDDGPNGELRVDDTENFHYWNRLTNVGGQVTCLELTGRNNDPGKTVMDATAAAATWTKIKTLFDRPSDSWGMSKALACTMTGIAAGHFDDLDGNAGTKTADETKVENIKAAMVGWTDTNGNNVPDQIENVASKSCLPKVQITRICDATSGCGQPKAICTSVTAANGGCDKADPSNRHAMMDATGVGTGLYVFFEKAERFEFSFDPFTNTGKQCARTEQMMIKNESPVTAALNTNDTMLLTFVSKSSKVCEGEEPTSEAEPKEFMKFIKQ